MITTVSLVLLSTQNKLMIASCPLSADTPVGLSVDVQHLFCPTRGKVREGISGQQGISGHGHSFRSLAADFANNGTVSEISKVEYACALAIIRKNCSRRECEGREMLCPELKDCPEIPYLTLVRKFGRAECKEFAIISLYPLYFWNFQPSMCPILLQLICAPTTSLIIRSCLFSLSLSYTSGLQFVFPINACKHAITNQSEAACIPGAWYTSLPAYLPLSDFFQGSGSKTRKDLVPRSYQ